MHLLEILASPSEEDNPARKLSVFLDSYPSPEKRAEAFQILELLRSGFHDDHPLRICQPICQIRMKTSSGMIEDLKRHPILFNNASLGLMRNVLTDKMNCVAIFKRNDNQWELIIFVTDHPFISTHRVILTPDYFVENLSGVPYDLRLCKAWIDEMRDCPILLQHVSEFQIVKAGIAIRRLELHWGDSVPLLNQPSVCHYGHDHISPEETVRINIVRSSQSRHPSLYFDLEVAKKMVVCGFNPEIGDSSPWKCKGFSLKVGAHWS